MNQKEEKLPKIDLGLSSSLRIENSPSSISSSRTLPLSETLISSSANTQFSKPSLSSEAARELSVMGDPSGSNANNKDGPAPATADEANEMEIDGSDEDLMLSKSGHLTRPEVLKRRSRRMKQLANIYKEHYWALMEDLKQKYKDYVWEHGISPFEGEEENREDANPRPAGEENQVINVKSEVVPVANGNSNSQCDLNACKMKAMALSKYCHAHILSDVNQKLYKPCSYVVKSSPTSPTRCQKPILRSTVPSLCPLHAEKAEKHVIRALRKAGLNVTSTSKLAPKFHVVVAEYVNQIQFKRRATRKAILDSAETAKILKALDPL